MALESILEADFKPSLFRFSFSDKGVSKLTVHCSCGRDYRVKEKLDDSGRKTYTRATKCPSCKEVSYLKHRITQVRVNDPEIGSVPRYSVEIVSL